MPRDANEPSRNYLRLVKKDEQQFPRVFPIEDVSTLIANADSNYIYRIYAPPGRDEHGAQVPSRIREELAQHLAGTTG